MVGSAIIRELLRQGIHQENIIIKNHLELDLINQAAVFDFFEKNKPKYVFLAAAKVGGIHANDSLPADFIYKNLMIEANIIHAAHISKTKKLLFLGSSCIYPREATQPIVEEALLTGPLEKTNEWYAIAKIAGIKLCQAYSKQYGDNFISIMPSNLYGPGDNFHPEYSHVPAALLQRFYLAKQQMTPEVTVWGTGNPKREFLHVDDLANACVFLMKNYDSPELINVGTGADITIRDFAETMKQVVGYEGNLKFDQSRPDGSPRKVLDMQKINALGWKASISLDEGLQDYFSWFKDNQAIIRT